MTRFLFPLPFPSLRCDKTRGIQIGKCSSIATWEGSFSGEWTCVMEKNLEGLHVGYSSSTLPSPLAGSLRAFFLDPHSKNLVRFLKSKSMKPWRPQRFQPIVFSYSDCYSCSVSSSDSLKLLVAWSYCRFYWLLLLSKSQGHVCLFSFLLYHFSL